MRDEEIKALLKDMSTEEKVGQLVQWAGFMLVDTDADMTGPEAEAGNGVRTMGSVLNFSNAKEAIEIQKTYMEKDPHRIPLLLMMDVIHGYRTIYPMPLAMACSFDDALVEKCAEMAAKEAQAGGVHVTFSPMADLSRDPRWGRVMESFGEDTYLGSRLGAAMVRGYQGDGPDVRANGVASCVKHFAGYGAAEAGRDYNTVDLSERTLRDAYLPIYEQCLNAGARLIMPSFNTLNGVPSVANAWLMKTILREEWGFDGVAISDYGAIRELISHGVAADLKDAALKAFRCECDMDMMAGAYAACLVSAVKEGKVSEEKLNKSVLRVLKVKNELGLFTDPYRGADPEAEERLCLSPAHRKLAREAAEKAAVLLKNDGLLPLDEQIRTLALIGPFADEHAVYGGWSCHGKAEDTVSVLEGLRALLPGVTLLVENGCDVTSAEKDEQAFARALEAAKQADAVLLCLGEPMAWSGEGNCRTDISLPGLQNELAVAIAKVNPKTAAVLFNGRPLVLTELDRDVPAILEMWYPGTEAGNAVANLLFGKVSPSGRLAMSFPRAVGQIPLHYDRLSTGRPKNKPDGVYEPFISNYLDLGNSPLYPFGFGLTYGNVKYDNFEMDSVMSMDGRLHVTFDVTNTGDRPCDEVVQIYIHDRVASVAPPVQKLIYYRKLHLEPGETVSTGYTVMSYELISLDVNSRYVLEPGDFDLFVGYADHPALSGTFLAKEGTEA